MSVCFVPTSSAGIRSTTITSSSRTNYSEPITLTFADGTFSGWAGCRDYEGEIIIDGDQVFVTTLGMVGDLCSDQSDQRREADYIEVVSEFSYFAIIDGQLVMTTRQGIEVVFAPVGG